MIIESLLDTDLYKFTMMQCVLHQFPGAEVSYRFRCRTPGVDLSPYADEIRDEVMHLCTLTFKDAELAYLGGLRFIKSDFVDFLSLFHLKDKYIRVTKDPACDFGLSIEITGPWLHTILFEIPILAIVNEVYFRHIAPVPDEAEGMRRLRAKIALLKNEPDNADLRVSDFGTRRRFSRAWQEKVVRVLIDELGSPIFSGTSNVDLARRYGLVSIGTMAHEYLQACQALGPRLRDSQVFGFEMWAKEYRGDLGIALSDVYGIEPFLKDFDMYFCKLFDGARHDSGDPFVWGERMIEHYRANKCDPRGKSLVFSDGLTVPRIIELYRRFHRRIGIGFGIGTNLMNDLGPQPLNIVVKMVRANGQPVAKISDNPVKGMCDDPTYLAYLRQVFGMPDKSVP
ncbi:nicotinate phosphoribosyltransferase [Duodenibacillus massiliensis]|jgi:nicotinate phosphoribosyltransferase|uniref:nicotinate phosphoribosyltransferase n=1 Tax=Duodenibacillus massiliensis TaxID=1852381 RepID=UPI00093FB555|nr:nicotinate phosphoribosyltransferase [Duodenibacillus massiliensis]MBS1386152.1 nicotinate phosphoribosyltransferase [Duodenibacillus sp.]HAF64618.1 nicotinate phosphoribosyltransferase [Sutterella sp.]